MKSFTHTLYLLLIFLLTACSSTSEDQAPKAPEPQNNEARIVLSGYTPQA